MIPGLKMASKYLHDELNNCKVAEYTAARIAVNYGAEEQLY